MRITDAIRRHQGMGKEREKKKNSEERSDLRAKGRAEIRPLIVHGSDAHFRILHRVTAYAQTDAQNRRTDPGNYKDRKYY